MKQNNLGTKTLTLQYLEGLLTVEELQQFSAALDGTDIALDARARPPRYIAGIESLFPEIQFVLSNDFVQALFVGVATNALYDVLKELVKLIRKLLCNKSFVKIKNGEVDTKTVPNIHFTIGEIHAVLPVNVDDEKYNYFVDKMFETVKEQAVAKKKRASIPGEREGVHLQRFHSPKAFYLVLNESTGQSELITKEKYAIRSIHKHSHKK